jgi:quercetin dioxygenase-like cupin family protein
VTESPPRNAPKNLRIFKGPTQVRYREATRFLWGDKTSGEVADVIYGRNDVLGTLIYKLKPGGYFRSSDEWKSWFDQNRFYLVLKGELAVQDPATGEIAVARTGEAVHFRGAKFHSGFNFKSEECWVLDWYAPMERPPHVSELEFGRTKPKFQGSKPGRDDLLGHWPDARHAARTEAEAGGGMVTVRREEALHFIHGDDHPVLESVMVSSKEMTAGVVELMPGARSDDRVHPSDKVIFVTSGKLHVYLPQSFDWFELDAWDLLYLPAGTPHQYWNYTDQKLGFAFMVVPRYA